MHVYTCSYLQYSSVQVSQNLYVCPENKYKSFWENNEYTPINPIVNNVRHMHARWRVTGPDADEKGLPRGFLGDYKSREDPEDEDEDRPYRPEVHPNEIMEIIVRYTQPGDLICDSTAGCLVTAQAAVRLGRYCIVVDKSDSDHMRDNSWKRLEQCYEFYRDDGILTPVGSVPLEPQWWELEGKTFMHRIQWYIEQNKLKELRRKTQEEKRKEREMINKKWVTYMHTLALPCSCV